MPPTFLLSWYELDVTGPFPAATQEASSGEATADEV